MLNFKKLALIRFFRFVWIHFVVEPYHILRNKPDLLKYTQDGNSLLYRTIFFWLLLLLFVLMPLMSLKFGRNSDETVSNNYGKDILKYLTTFGKDRSVFDTGKPGYQHMLYYGLSFDLLCAVVNKVSPFGEFETRHILNAIFGLLAMFFAALIARRLLNWRSSVLVLLFMFISPQFLGYSMNNAKDIPFATGYIAGIYFIIRFLEEFPSINKRTIAFLILSISFTCSNKINGIILIAYLALFISLIIGYDLWKNKSIKAAGQKIRSSLKYLIFIFFATYLLTISIWPFAQQGLIRNVWMSFRQFENIGNLMIHYELFDGNRLNMQFVPWYYTFKLMLITIPVYILLVFSVSIFGIKNISKKVNIYLLLLLFFVSFFPILYAIYKHSKLYNGWRHFLFIYPTFVVLAVFGWEYLLSTLKKQYLIYILVSILTVMIIKPLWWMIRNNPNEVAYFNEFTGGVNGAYTYYETDPLTNCGRQAIEWLMQNVDVSSTKVSVGSNIELESLKYYADKQPNKIDFIWLRIYNHGEYNWDYAIISTRGMSHSQLTSGGFPPKGTIHIIKADDAPLCVIVKKQNNFKYNGFQLYNNNEFEKAIPYFEKAIAFDSLDEEAITTLGGCYINLGNYKQGVELSVKGINLYNENYIAYNNLGVAEFFNKNYDKAIANYKKSLDYRVNWKVTLLNLAKTYFFLKEYDSAVIFFKKADLYFPNDLEVYKNLGELYKATNENELALKVYRKIISLDPNNINAIKNIEWLEHSHNNVNNDELEKAKYFSSQNQNDSAIICLNKILSRDSVNIDALLNRGVAYYLIKQYSKAITDFDHILRLNPKNSDAWLKKAQVLSVTGAKAKVLEYLNIALKIDPANYEALNERGHYFFSVNQFEYASADYSSSLNIIPNQPLILYSRAYVYSIKNSYDKALKDINDALRIDPEFGDAYLLRGMIFYKTGKIKESLDELDNAKKAGKKVDPNFENNLRNQLKTKSK